MKENKKLNMSGGHSLPPIGKAGENEENFQREIKVYQKHVAAAEENLKSLSEKIYTDTQKAADLEREFEKLKDQVGEVKPEISAKPLEGLSKKLNIITKSWKTNVAKMENVVKEKEAQLKLLQEQVTQINSRIFKQDQQRRLLDMSHDDYSSMKNSGKCISDVPDIYHPDVSFLYKPSVKALYST